MLFQPAVPERIEASYAVAVVISPGRCTPVLSPVRISASAFFSKAQSRVLLMNVENESISESACFENVMKLAKV